MVAEGVVLDGKYRIEQKLGAGGMGSVYRASHLGTDRPVAVKLIAPRFAARTDFLERFRREARAAGRLRHPNVVDVTDFGIAEPDGTAVPYLVMELLDGRTLAEALAEDPVPPIEWTAEVLDQACAALEEAHRRGIVHRDLKPENLWLEPDGRGGLRVKVLDFGLAHLTDGVADPVVAAAPSPAVDPLDDEAETMARVGTPAPPGSSSTLTQAGDVLGTPAYMSPEQWRGEPLDARSDIYALGVIAWRMLAGHPPFEGPADRVRAGHLAGTVPPLPERVPAAIRALVAEAMASDRADRPATPASFAAAFRARSASRAAFLRDVVTFTAARWPPLLRGSVVAHSPLLLLALVALVAGAWWPGAASPAWVRHLLPVAAFAMMLSLGALGVVAEALLLQVLVVPRRPVRLSELVRGLRSRVRPYLAAMAPFYVGFGLPWPALALLRDSPRPVRVGSAVVVAVVILWSVRHLESFWFAAQAAVTEGLDGAQARARSKELNALMRRHLKPLEQVANALILAIAGAALLLGTGLAAVVQQALPGFSVLAWAVGLLVGVATMTLFMPMGSLAFGLLYFRTREAGGEPLPRILAGFEEKLGVPPSVRPSPATPRPTPHGSGGR